MFFSSDTPLQSLPSMSRATLSKPGDIAYDSHTGRHHSSFYVGHQNILYPIYVPTQFNICHPEKLVSRYVPLKFLQKNSFLPHCTLQESDIAPCVINRPLCAFCPLHLARPPWIHPLVWEFLNGRSLLLTDAAYKTLSLKYHSKEDSPNFSATGRSIFNWNSTMSPKSSKNKPKKIS